jgi:hypothetical protein
MPYIFALMPWLATALTKSVITNMATSATSPTMSYYVELRNGKRYSARDESRALAHDPDPAVQRDAGLCTGLVCGAANASYKEADVKIGDSMVFPSCDPCVKIVGNVAIAYCADFDSNGYVRRIKILAAVKTTTGKPPVSLQWQRMALARYHQHRNNPKP